MHELFSQSGLSAEETRLLVKVGGILLLVFGGIALAVALAHLLSGIGVLKRWGWARILGIVMSVLGVLLWLLILVSNLLAASQRIPASYLSNSGLTVEEYRRLVGASSIAGVVIAGITLAAYTFVLVVLIRRGNEFS
jgi:tellurite resistance protein TehA-like permease